MNKTRGYTRALCGAVMGGCPPSLWPRFQRYTLSGGGNDFSRWLPPRTRLHFTKTGHLFGAPPEDGYQSVGPVGRSTFFGQFGGRPRGVDGGSGATGVLVEGGVSRGEAPRPIRSAQRKILASFGGLEAISVRKRHYQFGKPRPPNWAFFLLNILSLTQKSVQAALYISSTSLFNGGIITASQQAAFLWWVCPPYRPKCPKMGVRTRVRTHFFRCVAGSYA